MIFFRIFKSEKTDYSSSESNFISSYKLNVTVYILLVNNV